MFIESLFRLVANLLKFGYSELIELLLKRGMIIKHRDDEDDDLEDLLNDSYY